MTFLNPAEQLVGLVLEGGWVVEEMSLPSATATGGNFSVGYIVRHPDHGQRS